MPCLVLRLPTLKGASNKLKLPMGLAVSAFPSLHSYPVSSLWETSPCVPLTHWDSSALRGVFSVPWRSLNLPFPTRFPPFPAGPLKGVQNRGIWGSTLTLEL